jgi:copper chaperone CopZ
MVAPEGRQIAPRELGVWLRLRKRVIDSKEETKKVKAEFHIEGMHCDSCATSIKETLEETAGVRLADVTFKRKTAIVDFNDETVQQATLVKKIQDLGYTATISGQPQSEVGA